MCVCLVVGNMIGSGVFLLPASLAPFGWNAVFAWGLTIGGALCVATVFAHLARQMPLQGGPYAYTREAFGQLPAFAVAWSYWISLWVGNAAIAAGGVAYLGVLVPQLNATPGLSAVTTCVIVWIFTWINCRSIRISGGVQLITTVLKLLPLLAVAGLALFAVSANDGADIAPFRAEDISLAGITGAATLTLWAMLGLESATIPAGRVADPKRTIPLATMIGTIATGLVYLVVCSAVVLLLPAHQTADSTAPLADFVTQHWGEWARNVLALFAAISAFGALNGWILIQGELPYAMARDRVFPQWMGRLSANGIPVHAHLASSILLTAVVLLNVSRSTVELFTFLVLLATSASLILYLATALAAIRLGADGRVRTSTKFTTVAVVASAYAVWTLTGAGAEAMMWGAVLLASGIPVHMMLRNRRAG